MVLMHGGGHWVKCKLQSNIAHLCTKAEFVAACKMAKMTLFFWSLLQYVGIQQHDAMKLFEDNAGALLMANAQ